MVSADVLVLVCIFLVVLAAILWIMWRVF